jgi:hypothetical protein
MRGKQQSRDLAERFHALVTCEPNTGCWLWTGATRGKGYGGIRAYGKDAYAHRVSYELFRGPIPPGLVIDHLCRVHCCVNPDHLEVVTTLENVRRGVGLASERYLLRTHCRYGHPFVSGNIYVDRDGRRKCKACRRVDGRRHDPARRRAAREHAGDA